MAEAVRAAAAAARAMAAVKVTEVEGTRGAVSQAVSQERPEAEAARRARSSDARAVADAADPHQRTRVIAEAPAGAGQTAVGPPGRSRAAWAGAAWGGAACGGGAAGGSGAAALGAIMEAPPPLTKGGVACGAAGGGMAWGGAAGGERVSHLSNWAEISNWDTQVSGKSSASGK